MRSLPWSSFLGAQKGHLEQEAACGASQGTWEALSCFCPGAAPGPAAIQEASAGAGGLNGEAG